MSARLRFGTVVATDGDYVTVTVDGVDVPAWAGPDAVNYAVGDIAWCVQDGRRLVALAPGAPAIPSITPTDTLIFCLYGAMGSCGPNSWYTWGGALGEFDSPVGSEHMMVWGSSDLSADVIEWPTQLTDFWLASAFVVRGNVNPLGYTYGNLQGGTGSYTGPVFGEFLINAGPDSIVAAMSATNSLTTVNVTGNGYAGTFVSEYSLVAAATASFDMVAVETDVAPSATIDYTTGYSSTPTIMTWAVIDKYADEEQHVWEVPVGWQYGEPVTRLVI